MESTELIKKMLKAGWVPRSVKGSHRFYSYPDKQGHVSVPDPKKDLGTGLLPELNRPLV